MKKTIKKILKEYNDITLKQNRFQELYDSLWEKMLYSVCMKFTNDTELAKDYCQSGLVKAYQNLNTFKGDGSLEGWVRRIIRNNIIDTLRKNKLNYVDEEPDWGRMEKWSYDPENKEEFNIEGVSGSDIIKLSQNLSPQYKKIFDLYYIEGYKHQEIAKILGIKVGTSKSNLAKAKYNIRKYLNI